MNYSDSIALIAAERSEVAANLSEQAATTSWNAAIIALVAAIIGIVGPIIVHALIQHLKDKHRQAELCKQYLSVADKLALRMSSGNEHKDKFDLVMLELARMTQFERVKFLQENGIADIVAFYEWLDPQCPGWPVTTLSEYTVLKGNNKD